MATGASDSLQCLGIAGGAISFLAGKIALEKGIQARGPECALSACQHRLARMHLQQAKAGLTDLTQELEQHLEKMLATYLLNKDIFLKCIDPLRVGINQIFLTLCAPPGFSGLPLISEGVVTQLGQN